MQAEKTEECRRGFCSRQAFAASTPVARFRFARHASSADTPEVNREVRPSNPDLLEDYQEIGQTLLSCEAACYTSGIAWLPPTACIRERAMRFYGSRDEFVKQSLVSVQSKSLECYTSDLSSAALEDDQALYIPMPNVLERYALSVLLFGIFFAASFIAANALGFPLLFRIAFSTSVAMVGAVLGVIVSSEVYRRKSFMDLLESELNRRRGMDDDAGSPVVASIDTKPVSE